MNYADHYARLVSRATQRPLTSNNPDYEVHHIIPRCMGGPHSPDNLVSLKLEEHCVAHMLLARLYPDHALIVLAASRMTGAGSELKGPRNKRYARYRRLRARRWKSLRGTVHFRRAIRKPKRYTAVDVERLAKMLTPLGN